jgi:peptidoglycan/xylan/chitin deacetylase (PgdA/CDA1 family)
MYHAIMEPPEGCDDIERDLFVSADQFETQMADLAQRGFRSISLREFENAKDRTVLITFDDGYAHVLERVTPILERHRFSAVMFVPTAYLGGRNSWDADRHPRLGALEIATADQIRRMAAGSWEIASHSFRHVDMRSLEPTTRMKELVESRETLSAITRKPVTALAYPYGDVDSSVEKSAQMAGFQMAFLAGPGSRGNPFRLSRQPVRGSDDLAIFRLRTSGWLGRFHALQRIAPAWARSAVRAAVNGVNTGTR